MAGMGKTNSQRIEAMCLMQNEISSMEEMQNITRWLDQLVKLHKDSAQQALPALVVKAKKAEMVHPVAVATLVVHTTILGFINSGCLHLTELIQTAGL